MNNISYITVGTITWGMTAIAACNNMPGSPATMLPEIQCKYVKEIPGISVPQISEVYQSKSIYALYTDQERMILDVLAVMTREPSKLDLDMLAAMDDDIWDLF